MKKLLSMLITASMIFSTVAISASAEVTLPEGKSAKTLASDAVTTVNFKTDTANYDGGNDRATAYHLDFEGVSYDFRAYNEIAINIYVDAPKDGEYGLQTIGRTHYYGSISDTSNTITVTDATGTVNTTVTGPISITKADTTSTQAVNEAANFGGITLKAGLNVITISSSSNQQFVGGIRIVGCDLPWYPKGVYPMELDVDDTATSYFETTTGLPIVGGVMQNQYWKGTYNGNQYFRVRGDSAGSTMDLYVNAPIAGNYNLKTIQSRAASGYSSNLSLSVNGTTVKSTGVVPTATGWVEELVSWGEVSLNQGINKISFGFNNNHCFCGFEIAGPGVIELPSGITAKGVSQSTSVTIEADDAAVKHGSYAPTKLEKKTAVSDPDTAFYVDAAEAGTYFVSLNGLTSTGNWERYALTVNNTVTTAAKYLYLNSNMESFEDALCTYAVELKAGLNKISFAQKKHQIFFKSMTVTGTGAELASAYDISTAGDKVKYTFEVEKADATVDYQQMMNHDERFEVMVDAAVAGDYYVTVYSMSRNNASSTVDVYVNEKDAQTISYAVGYNAYNDGVLGGKYKANTLKVTLAEGLNKISVHSNNTNACIDKIELRNYDMGISSATTTNYGLYGTALEAAATPVASSPRVVTKSVVYDAIPASATTLNVSTLYVVKGTADRAIFAASYDADGKLIDTKLINQYSNYNTFVGAKATGLNVAGAATVKVILLDDLTNLTNIDTEIFSAAQ